MNEEDKAESVILCEGYYDRAFWDGFLTELGCTSLKPPPGKPLMDPFALEVKRDYAYRSKSGNFIRVRPCDSKDKIRKAAEVRLKERTTKTLRYLVINVDADTNADGTQNISRTMGFQSVTNLVRELDPAMRVITAGRLAIDGGATEICLVRWQADDPPGPGLPNQQTLERLACAALATVYPERGKCIEDWLLSRPDAPPLGVKEYALSHMVGWNVEQGCDAFYKCLWIEKGVKEELKTRLKNFGAWQIAEALAS